MKKILEAARADSKDKANLFALVLLLRYSGLRISDATMLHTDALEGQSTHGLNHQNGQFRGFCDFAASGVRAVVQHQGVEHGGYFFWNGASTLHSVTDLFRDHYPAAGV